MTRPTKRPVVLHVLEALSSGTSRHVIDVVRHTQGVEHVVAVPPQRSTGLTDLEAVDALKEAGAAVSIIDMRRTPLHPVHAGALARLTRLARRSGADVVHGHSAIGGALARMLPLSVATVYTPHGLFPSRAAHAVERVLGRRTSRIVAVSASERDELVRRSIVPPERCVVIPNGVSLSSPRQGGRLRSALGLQPDVPLVGSVGRAADQKRPLDFVAMCKLVGAARPDVHFVLVADGPLSQEVDRAALELGARFTRLSHLPGIASTMQDVDVFALLSEYEGGPYVPLEAAAAGVPLVLSDVVGNRDVLVDGESGFLVPRASPSAAAARVLELLASPPLAQALVRAMNERLARCFDVQLQAAAHQALYEELLS